MGEARAIVVIEGRDGAGKTTLARKLERQIDGARRISLPRPTDDEMRRRYFSRWVDLIRHEDARVLVLDRSWYSRPCVEAPMGFCTAAELARFYREVPRVERALVRNHFRVVKVYLDVSDAEQVRRLAKRPAPTEVDRESIARAADFRHAAEEMRERTSFPFAPWNVVYGGAKKKGLTEWIADCCAGGPGLGKL